MNFCEIMDIYEEENPYENIIKSKKTVFFLFLKIRGK